MGLKAKKLCGEQAVTTAKDRRHEVGKTLNSAMAQLKDVDWSRESEGTIQAQAELDEVVSKFCEGNASKADVKSAYKQFVNAHRGGLFG